MLGVVATRLGSLARQPWFLPLAICYTLLSAFVLSFAPRFWDLVPTVVLLVASVVLVWYLVALARPFRTGWNSIIAVGLLLPILALLVWHWTPIPALPWAWPKSLPLGASLGIPVFLALFAAASALAASVRQAAQAALIVGAAIFVCAYPWDFRWVAVIRWAALAVLTLAFLLVLGRWSTGTWKGIFLGPANTWSLSVTQALLWTCIVVPALLVLWMARMGRGDPLSLEGFMDPSLLIVMGLPIGTAAVAGGIVAGKARSATGAGPDEAAFAAAYLDDLWKDYAEREGLSPQVPDHVRQAFRAQGPAGGLKRMADRAKQLAPPAVAPLQPGVASPAKQVDGFVKHTRDYLKDATKGSLLTNLRPGEARFSDMLRCDDAGNAHATSFGKVQFFLLSLIAMVAYCAALVAALHGMGGSCRADACPRLPALDGPFATLLLTSAGAYLGIKSIPAP